MSYNLILLRHGESIWNAKNLFTGWVDVSLSETGENEAKHGGELIKKFGILPDIVHTSLLKRAITTANLSLNEIDRHWIPVKRTWRLNERHYGALQGKDKSEIRNEYGEEKFMIWRRSYDVPPPKIDPNDKYSQSNDIRYKDISQVLTESLKLVLKRALPYFNSEIVPDLKSGKNVLVAAHGNSIRALIKYLDDISDSEISSLNVPTGIPLYYKLDNNLKPTQKGGQYLDPVAAKKAIDAVANQGK